MPKYWPSCSYWLLELLSARYTIMALIFNGASCFGFWAFRNKNGLAPRGRTPASETPASQLGVPLALLRVPRALRRPWRLPSRAALALCLPPQRRHGRRRRRGGQEARGGPELARGTTAGAGGGEGGGWNAIAPKKKNYQPSVDRERERDYRIQP